MYSYETLFILQTDLPEAQIRETIDRAKRLIETQGGTVSQVHEWGVRDLAYPIQKQKRGYYVLIEYGSEPKVVWEFERTLKIADEVLRFVSVRQHEVKPKKKKRSRKPAPPRPPQDVEEIEMPDDM